jgi:ABC-type antimicrobial peptide transport system permease subunit
MTKIDIFSGFLGAGKTTLIKKLLGEVYQGEKIVLIENEFGEISIVGGFLKESGVQISEMSSGCICCSLVGDFNQALKEVVAQYQPDRVLIEPSGVGKLSDVIVAVENAVAESEGTILDKTKLLMILITALSLIGSALGISNLVTASVMERAQEIGLLKAIGAKDRSITGVVMTEIFITALVGFAAGYFMGFGFAQLIGRSVFGAAVEMNPTVIPIVAGLIALVTIAGSLPAIRMVLRLRPAEVLHGGH